jgi:hypothetical protein
MIGKKVLEIGASSRSSVAPVFARLGSRAVCCSYYNHKRDDICNGQLRAVIEKYQLDDIPVFELNITEIAGIYDVIVLKSVLGGICRGQDYNRMQGLIGKMMTHLSDDGFILSLDNGYVGLFHRLRWLWGAGKNDWTYFERDKLISVLSGYEVEVRGFGILNFASPNLLFKKDLEFVNDFLYLVDKIILRLLKVEGSAILSTIVRKKVEARGSRPEPEECAISRPAPLAVSHDST